MTRTFTTSPPMGWNSWDCFGTGVTEAEVMENARFMAERLSDVGWDTVVVDAQWFETDVKAHGYHEVSRPELDVHGRQIPAVNRFPSAAGGAGFRPLSDAVHALGLKFGIHLMRGIPRAGVAAAAPIPGTDATLADIAVPEDDCPWNPDNVGVDHTHPATQSWIDAQVAQFASWGVDFLKLDDVLWPYHEADIRAYRAAIAASGRDIVLSLSPGRALSTEHAESLKQDADMWRISDDLWDRWEDVVEQFPRAARWARHGGEGRWIDLDMLPLGRIGIRAERGDDRLSALTLPEQRTLVSLWCFVRSPLMFGGHLPNTPEDTLALLREPRVLALLDDLRAPREVISDRGWIAWVADGVGEFAAYAAAFRVGDEAGEVTIAVRDLGLRADDRIVDLWTGAPVTVLPTLPEPSVKLTAAAHDVVLLGARR